MASIKVAVRVRPLNAREKGLNSDFIIDMEGQNTFIANPKVGSYAIGDSHREKMKTFCYDYSYWTVDEGDQRYASQEKVFQDLGTDVITSAYEGYNACVFAYGQTGSGKTYTMMGTEENSGLIPRICEALFARMNDNTMTYRCEVSYLEIYNERVRDLLRRSGSSGTVQHTLRVREHPKDGPYVQDLSKHLVMNYEEIRHLMDKGSELRATASTNMNDVSSRSHAIFTIVFTQAKFSKDSPSEMHSKIHLVDLAGSERADATGATGQRLKEGSSINKSLVTLGNVISTLADMSEKGNNRRPIYIPYRDSVLTWLLKDSLGGNAKTMMIANVSPADCCYAETLSTLRYANRAKNIINKPIINEDTNVKLIRELRAEISRLRMLLGGKPDNISAPKVQEKLHENEARVKVLTEEWTGKWKEMAHILQEERQLALRKQGLGVVLDSVLPHLIGIDDDILSTGIMLFHIKEGRTAIGTKYAPIKQDIVLQGEEVLEEHCVLEHEHGHVTLIPMKEALCTVNGTDIQDPIRLTQGAVILLGKTNMFRFNHPAEAEKLRQEFKGSNLNLNRTSLSQSMSDLARSTENLALLTSGWEMEQRHREQLEALEEKRQQIEEMEERHRQAETDRSTEQAQKEDELEQTRQRLELMRSEAEKVKQEATQMQEAMELEKKKLQRQSQDLEKTVNEMMAKRQQEQDERARLKRNSLVEAPRLDELGRVIESEMLEVSQAEQQSLHRFAELKEELDKEIEMLRFQQAEKRSQYEEECRKMAIREEVQRKQLDQLSEEIEQKRKLIEWERDTELEIIAEEKKNLEFLRTEYDNHRDYSAKLDESARKRIEEESERVRRARDELNAKETEMYASFKADQEAIEARRTRVWAEIHKKQQELSADKVILQECEEKYSKAMETLDPGDLLLQEQLEKDRIAIESERERIAEDEVALQEQEEEIKRSCERDEEDLRMKRDDQIESLKESRETLKKMEVERLEFINEELDKRNHAYSRKTSLIDQEEEALEQMETEQLSVAEQLAELQQAAEEHRQQLQDVTLEHEAQLETSIAELQVKRRRLDKDERRSLDRLTARRRRLSELSSRQKLLSSDSEGEAAALAIEEDLNLLRAETEATSDEDVYNPMLRQQISELRHQLTVTEAELEEQRLLDERKRQEELDKIDWEKFKLQEMEEMERINALVEQEVKRRLLEERVQREKQRRIEREKERLEREQELNKIRKAHEKELQRLKDRYESTQCVHVNVPTKANPYANTMTGEGIGTVVRRFNTEPMQIPYNHEKPIIICIPGFIQRGSAFDTHYEFEVKLMVGVDIWAVYRRYSRFRELHADLKARFPQIGAIVFPPKKLLGNRSEKVVAERRKLLEDYLQNVIEVLMKNPECILHPSHTKVYSKQVMHEFHQFFKKGLFEVSKHGTA